MCYIHPLSKAPSLLTFLSDAHPVRQKVSF